MLILIIDESQFVDKCFLPLDAVLYYSCMHPKISKRRKQAQLTFIYALMVVVIAVSVTILLLLIQGYRYNRFDGKVEQGGLMQFDSAPDGADVTLDVVRLANKTPSKITATADTHTVTISKDGYEPWQKQVIVKPGGVLWLNYATLFPKAPVQDAVVSTSSVSSLVASPNNSQLAYTSSSTEPVVVVADINADVFAPRALRLPAGILSIAPEGQPQTLRVKEWSRDNQFVLVSHDFGDTTEYLVVDSRAPDEARNISKELGVVARDVAFAYGDSNTLYILTVSHELRQVNIAERTLSGPLLTNVASFSQFDRSTIEFATLPDANGVRQVGYLTPSTARAKILRTFNADTSQAFMARFGRYYNKNYLLVVQGSRVEILTGDIPSSSSTEPLSWKTITVFESPGAEFIGFSPGGNRFAYVQHGTSLTVYDLELSIISKVTLPAANGRRIDWVDPYHIATSTGAKVMFSDFDGTNAVTVAAKDAANLPVVFSSNGKYVYHTSVSAGGASLIRTKLVVGS